MICISCNNEHQEKFCPNCGEQSEVAQITFATIANDFFSNITNMDKGFLFNVKNLLLKPGEIVNNYILGKRKNIFNPVSFLIISTTIYLIVDSLFITKVEGPAIKSEVYDAGLVAGRFMKAHAKYLWILSIFWMSISTKLIFQKYNFAEHLAINAFVIGQATLIGIIGFLIFDLTMEINPITHLVIIWMTYKIFETEDKGDSILLKSVFATLFFFIIGMAFTLFLSQINLRFFS